MATETLSLPSNNAERLNDEPSKRTEDQCEDFVCEDEKLAKAINRVHKVNPKNLQCVSSANFVLNERYHQDILDQANKSFRTALVSSIIGGVFFLLTAAFFMMKDATLVYLISGVGAAITALVSGTSFYLYRTTLKQLEHFHTCLARTEMLLLGNSLCKQMEEKEQNKGYMKLVENIAELTMLISNCDQKLH